MINMYVYIYILQISSIGYPLYPIFILGHLGTESHGLIRQVTHPRTPGGLPSGYSQHSRGSPMKINDLP